ncbi:MAG: hypothetical protein HYX88_03925 [Chloroflexi bacterium]|nr:hypothetical protein [Chloroflexota bacterium]
MSLLDALLGRSRPVRSRLENLFAISTAVVTLTERLNLKPSARAGICFKPLSSSPFQASERDLMDLISLSTKASHTRMEAVKDNYGFQWITLEDEDFEDLVTNIHMVSQSLEEEGYGGQLLAAVFKFHDEGELPLFWIYNYKRGKFYPFVPKGKRERDNPTEIHLQALMEKELPLEPDLEKWYALWGIPL